MQLGMDLVRQAREAAKSNSAPASRDRQMAEAHRAALVRYEGQVRQHQGRIAGAKAGVVAGGAGTAVLGLSTVASAGSPGQMLFLGGLTAGTAALGGGRDAGPRTSRRTRRSRSSPRCRRPGCAQALAAPTRPTASPTPCCTSTTSSPTSAGCTRRPGRSCGAPSATWSRCCAARWSGWRRWTGSSGRCPDPGPRRPRSRPAPRSPAGCAPGADALEDLIAAAARMLAAPDIGDGVPDALAPAIDSLDAFAHGLNAANAARLGGP